MMELQWKCTFFDELTAKELYAIMHLRSEVFVVEQNCIYLDADFKDPHCYHLTGWNGDKLAAYARLVPPGVSYEEMSIGRVVTSPFYRGGGLGRQLMQNALYNCALIFGEKAIKIGAQLYLEKMYKSFGFQPVGEVYLEDGIEHIHMIRI